MTEKRYTYVGEFRLKDNETGDYISISNDISDEDILKIFLEALKEELSLANRDNDALEEENERLKQSQARALRELLIYRKIASCSNCKHQNYDWFEDGDEFEICEKGNSNQQIEYHICKEWEEFY